MSAIDKQFEKIITKNSKQTREELSFLYQSMEKKDCKFANELVPTFLRPLFLSQEEVRQIKAVTRHIMSILEKVTQLFFKEPRLKGYFYLNKQARELMKIEPGFKRHIVISRPDSFLVDSVLRFVEFNCDSPAGAGYCDIQEKIFLKTSPLRQLSHQYAFARAKRQEMLLKALLESYRQFSRKKKKPHIAIVDWRDVRTINEFRILKSYFETHGCPTTIADPRELRLIGGRLEHRGFPIDLVYRRVIFRELMAHYDEVKDFITAYKRGRVCIINPLRSRLASNKAVLSIITNQKKFSGFFSDEENKVIQKHIPWTRRLRDIETTYQNNKVFLKKHVIAHRESLVLKPSDSYGGKDVMIGREISQKDWEARIRRIFRNKEDWVVQKYVKINEMRVPIPDKGRVRLVRKKYNLNPFVFGGQYAGTLSRLSDKSVINVSAGGGLIPAIAYRKR